jgi:hypothetical protein
MGNYIYAAVENSQECYCGLTISPFSTPHTAAYCSSPCAADNSASCGGYGYLTLYELRTAVDTTNTTNTTSSTSSTISPPTSSNSATSEEETGNVFEGYVPRERTHEPPERKTIDWSRFEGLESFDFGTRNGRESGGGGWGNFYAGPPEIAVGEGREKGLEGGKILRQRDTFDAWKKGEVGEIRPKGPGDVMKPVMIADTPTFGERVINRREMEAVMTKMDAGLRGSTYETRALPTLPGSLWIEGEGGMEEPVELDGEERQKVRKEVLELGNADSPTLGKGDTEKSVGQIGATTEIGKK